MRRRDECNFVNVSTCAFNKGGKYSLVTEKLNSVVGYFLSALSNCDCNKVVWRYHMQWHAWKLRRFTADAAHTTFCRTTFY